MNSVIISSVGIGFGRKGCSVYSVAGWKSDTWALHGDDGGFFHGSGFPRDHSENTCRYSNGDVIGVCIDVRAGMAFYTKNGKVIETGFEDIRGRLFPMACLGSGAQIKANFGADLNAVPFQYPEGRDRDYSVVTKLIGDMPF
ncbi:hypothetical protein F4806DRAFT_465929 [Annulohypoxylon nitens]|nr:hypothetical protein F4806DRAFT_465929 [Annulohypoxylon nitens]